MAVPTVPVSSTTLRRISGISTTQLTIPSRIGYRHQLLDLFVTGEVPLAVYDIVVGTRTFMRLPAKAASSDALNPPQVKKNGRGFLWSWAQIFGVENLPNAADDEDIVINSSSAVTRLDAYYTETQPADVKSHTVAGGSDAPAKPFVEIFDKLISAAGNGQSVTVENMPTGLGLLDNNGLVKPNTTFTQNFIMADYVSSGANFTRYARLHIFDEDVELYTPVNHEGLLIDETIPANDLRLNFSTGYMFRADKDYDWLPSHAMTLLADVPAVTGTGSTLRTALFGLRTSK